MAEGKTLNQVARELGINPGMIYRAHNMDGLQEPTERYGPTRIYHEHDIERLKKHLASKRRKKGSGK